MDAGSIVGLVTAALFFLGVVALIVIILVIRAKVRKYQKEWGLQARGLMSDINSTNDVGKNPASLNGMDRIYIPKIQNDFPDFQLAPVIPQVETFIKAFLDSVEDKDTSALKKLAIAPSLVDRAEEIIKDVNSQALNVYYDNIVIHKTVISEYVKEKGMVIIRFQSAVGYLHYAENDKGKLVSGSKEVAEETVYVTSYARILDSELARQSGVIDVIGLNCPNCGAPLRSSNVTICEFCGTGVQNMTEDVFGWTFTDIKEKNRMTQKLF